MRRLHIVALALLLSGRAYAADGATCAVSNRYDGQNTPWQWTCNIVCDSKTSASSTCSDFTIAHAADTYEFVITHHTTCAADPTVTITTKDAAGEDTSDVAVLDYDTVTPANGVVRAVLDGAAAHPLSILSFALSDMGSCADFDVKLIRGYKTRGW